MKKFITSCPIQPKGILGCSLYHIDGNAKIEKNNVETHFPIIPLIYTYAASGEEIQLMLIKSANENTDYNKSLLEQELSIAEQKLNIKVNLIQVDTNFDENITTQLRLFSDMIEYIQDEDELYVCLTYGTKPTPIVQMMVLNYAYRILNNVKIGCIVYGQRDFKTKESTIFDVSSLFFMDEAVNNLSKLNLENPVAIIKKMLDLDTDFNAE